MTPCRHARLCPPGARHSQRPQTLEAQCGPLSCPAVAALLQVSTSRPEVSHLIVCVTAAYAIHVSKRLRLWILNSLGTFFSQASRVSNGFTLQLGCSFLLPTHPQCSSPWSSHLSSPPGLSPAAPPLGRPPSLLLSSKAAVTGVTGTRLAQPHTHRLPFPAR